MKGERFGLKLRNCAKEKKKKALESNNTGCKEDCRNGSQLVLQNEIQNYIT